MLFYAEAITEYSYILYSFTGDSYKAFLEISNYMYCSLVKRYKGVPSILLTEMTDINTSVSENGALCVSHDYITYGLDYFLSCFIEIF